MPTYDEVIQRIIPEIEFHQNRYARGLADLVQTGCRWLDIGAGTKLHHGWIGTRADDLAKRAGMLVGCDMVETHLLRNASLDAAAVADAMQLPFRDGAFDLVTANMVLEHLEDPEQVFAEITRVMAPGAFFAFVTPNLDNPVVRVASIALSKPVRKRLAHFTDGRDEEHIFDTFYRANSRSAIERLCADHSLVARQIETFNSYPFTRGLWPLTALESVWIKAISHSPLKRITTNLFGVLQKADDLR